MSNFLSDPNRWCHQWVAFFRLSHKLIIYGFKHRVKISGLFYHYFGSYDQITKFILSKSLSPYILPVFTK